MEDMFCGDVEEMKEKKREGDLREEVGFEEIGIWGFEEIRDLGFGGCNCMVKRGPRRWGEVLRR